MESVRDWLESIGLGRYADAFEENAVELGHLADLDHNTLKELGVSAIGHRLTLLKAATGLPEPMASRRPDDPAKEGFHPPPESHPHHVSSGADEAERRQLTVMFADLVGSTALSQRLDMEDLRDVNRAYQLAARDAIKHFEGSVARYMGDGVLAYFGFPAAHEDDAERAVRAGLALVEAVNTLDMANWLGESERLEVRVGIATGPVVVGDLIGEGMSQEHAAVGETPNLAARLQSEAGSNSILICPTTRAMLGDFFELAQLEPISLKGLKDPVGPWLVNREKEAGSRFRATRDGALASFVGREGEAALVLHRWEQAKQAEGQLVAIIGEAGIGKSRMSQAIFDSIAADSPKVLEFQCDPYASNSALHPFATHLELSAALAPSDESSIRLEKLKGLLDSTDPELAQQWLPVLSRLLSVTGPSAGGDLDVTPQREKELTFQALTAYISLQAQKAPVLLLFEDAHWADPTSKEFLERLLSELETNRILILITTRPEYEPPGRGVAYQTTIRLKALTKRQVRSMVLGMALAFEFSDEDTATIIERSDGVPLFVEALVRDLVEQKHGNDNQAVPTSLHAMLLSRLDRVDDAKSVAQVAAVVGRETPWTVLQAATGESDREFERKMIKLTQAGLVHTLVTDQGRLCVFEHALIQDAAYGSMLRSVRSNYHRLLATTLRSQFPDLEVTAPERLARHYSECDEPELAVEFWMRAARRASQQSAHAETLRCIEAALENCERIGSLTKRRELEFDLQIARGNEHILATGHGSPEAATAYQRARRLARELADSERTFLSVYSLWRRENGTADFEAGEESARDLLELAKHDGSPSMLTIGYYVATSMDFFCGRFDSACTHAEVSLDVAHPSGTTPSLFRIGQDPRVMTRIYWGLSRQMQGRPSDATASFRKALDFASDSDHPYTLATAMAFEAILHQLRGDTAATLASATSAVEYCEEHGFEAWTRVSDALRAWATVLDGGVDAVQKLAVFAPWEDDTVTGLQILRPYILLLALEARGTVDPVAALTHRSIGEAETLIARSGIRAFEADWYRLRGTLSLVASDNYAENARDDLTRAIEIAGSQGAHLPRLRAAIALANHAVTVDPPTSDIFNLVRRVCEEYSGAHDVPELQIAHSLVQSFPSG